MDYFKYSSNRKTDKFLLGSQTLDVLNAVIDVEHTLNQPKYHLNIQKLEMVLLSKQDNSPRDHVNHPISPQTEQVSPSNNLDFRNHPEQFQLRHKGKGL